MNPQRSRHQQFLDQVTCSYIKEFSPETGNDLLVRDVELSSDPIEREVDLVLVDLEERYIEAIGVHVDPLSGREIRLPELGEVVQRLGSNWKYELYAVTEPGSSLNEITEPLDGNVYFDEEDEWKFHSNLFSDLSRELFSYDPVERYDVIDPEDCSNI